MFFFNIKMSNKAAKFNMEDLTLNDITKRMGYRRRREEEKKGIHWGQRKLLLSEIEFLTICWNPTTVPNPLCVYAGAAPGTHIPILSMLFPSIVFHLYDPREFSIKATDKITIYQEYFTDDVAQRYANRSDVFFICDIRTACYSDIETKKLSSFGIRKFDNRGNPIGNQQLIRKAHKEAQVENEDQIWVDMTMQQNWVMIMNPEEAFLKFRLPYALDGKDRIVQYLQGMVYWQAWAPQTSTETRLKPFRNASGVYEAKDWSILEYEEWCFYHNVVEREQTKYLNPLTNTTAPIDPPELLNDYDSTAEAYILKLYYEKFAVQDTYPGISNQQTLDKLKSDVVNLSRYITRYISANQSTKLTLASLRASPTKSANRRAMGTCTKKPSYQHTKVVMNPTWRRFTSPN